MKQHDMHGPRAALNARPDVCPDLFESRGDPWFTDVERLYEAAPKGFYKPFRRPKPQPVREVGEISQLPANIAKRLAFEGADRAHRERREEVARAEAWARVQGPRPVKIDAEAVVLTPEMQDLRAQQRAEIAERAEKARIYEQNQRNGRIAARLLDLMVECFA